METAFAIDEQQQSDRLRPAKEQWDLNWVYLPLIFFVITLTYCTHYGLWTKEAWNCPVAYAQPRSSLEMAFSSDALWGMSFTKASADREIGFFDKRPASFGAPFRADWNQWPTTEEAINYWWMLLARLFGLFVGSNLVLLSAHLLAGFAFYFLCSTLGYRRAFAATGAVLFALSHFAFWRSLPHLSLVFYWHVPLGLSVAWLLLRAPNPFNNRRVLTYCVLLAVAFGFQSPYYSAVFLQFLLGVAFLRFFASRRLRDILPASGLGLVVIFTAGFANVDTLRDWAVHGNSFQAVSRSFHDIELWALKPVELLVPATHSISAFEQWAQKSYYNQAMFLGESGAPYLGLVAIAALALLTARVVIVLTSGKGGEIPLHFWCILWITCYSIVGGITLVTGLANIFFLRATNRFSIVIEAVALLYLVKELSCMTRDWNRLAVCALAALLVLFGIYDQVPPRRANFEKDSRAKFAADHRFGDALNEKLPSNAMVFELPVMPFPEGRPIGGMTEYEHFRPYLYTTQLRYSFAESKANYSDRWQRDNEQFSPEQLARNLEAYGFSAVLINRRAYADEAASLLDKFSDAGKKHILAQSSDLICIGLNPSRHPELPPEFGSGWSYLEGDEVHNRRWSSGNAQLVLYNTDTAPRSVTISFALISQSSRQVQIEGAGKIFFQRQLEPFDPEQPVNFRHELQPGANRIWFKTNRAATLASAGDPRQLAFAILDFRVIPQAGSGSSE